jgi:hypothetical protein
LEKTDAAQTLARFCAPIRRAREHRPSLHVTCFTQPCCASCYRLSACASIFLVGLLLTAAIMLMVAPASVTWALSFIQ